MCTINKSALMKKSGNLFNDPRMYKLHPVNCFESAVFKCVWLVVISPEYYYFYIIMMVMTTRDTLLICHHHNHYYFNQLY